MKTIVIPVIIDGSLTFTVETKKTEPLNEEGVVLCRISGHYRNKSIGKMILKEYKTITQDETTTVIQLSEVDEAIKVVSECYDLLF